MHIKDHSAAMKFFRTYDNVASKGKWKEFVDEMEFESMVQEPRITAQEPRNMAHGGVIGKPGGIVEPGIEYYAKFKSSSSKLRQLRDGTWKYITHDNEHITGEKKLDVIKKMKKRSELRQKN